MDNGVAPLRCALDGEDIPIGGISTHYNRAHKCKMNEIPPEAMERYYKMRATQSAANDSSSIWCEHCPLISSSMLSFQFHMSRDHSAVALNPPERCPFCVENNANMDIDEIRAHVLEKHLKISEYSLAPVSVPTAVRRIKEEDESAQEEEDFRDGESDGGVDMAAVETKRDKPKTKRGRKRKLWGERA